MIERIAILGTGLLGTSIGLALRAAGFGGSITGWNRSPEGGQEALRMNAVDSLAHDALQAARDSQIIVLCVPIYSTLDYMEQLSAILGPDHMVTDVGSTKVQITTAAGRLFNAPDRAAFLPGHPMAGKERGGASLGDPGLFRGRGVAFYRQSRLAALAGLGRTSLQLARLGPCHGLPHHQSRRRSS